MSNENNSSAPLKTAGEPFVALGECIADQVCLSVAELPDRDSPADWPQAMLVTSDELRNIVLNAINYAAQAVAAQAAPAAVAVPTSHFDDPRVQAVYSILCGDETPPKNEHWEGFIARRIVDALATPRLPATEDSSAGDLAEVQAEPVALQMCSELRPRTESEKAAYLAGVADGRMYAERDADTAPQAQPADALLRHALELAFDHIDMDSLRLSHCKDAAVIDAAMAAAQEGGNAAKEA